MYGSARGVLFHMAVNVVVELCCCGGCLCVRGARLG
jgi:hypothetical protein